jgi:hypothetical protein
MTLYGTELQKDVRDLFQKKDYDQQEYQKIIYEIKDDHNNDKYITGKDVADEMVKVKYILEEMLEDLEDYDEEYDTYLIYNMGKYYVGNYELGKNTSWIYEYEIKEYYNIIEIKLNEYYSLEKIIEDEKAKIQLEKDVCLGVALALALMR